jgi:signal transduction histidine kinase
MEALAADEASASRLTALGLDLSAEAGHAFGCALRQLSRPQDDTTEQSSTDRFAFLCKELDNSFSKRNELPPQLTQKVIVQFRRYSHDALTLITAMERIPRDSSSTIGRLNMFAQIAPLTTQLGRDLKYMRDYDEQVEKARAEIRRKQAEARSQMKRQIAYAVGLEIASTIMVVFLFLNNITQRLNTLVSNAKLIPTDQSLTQTVSGGDELAYLDQVLHKASSSLHRAAEHKRALMQMVAHDLRTPLMSAGILATRLIAASKTRDEELLPHLQKLRHTCDLVVGFVEDLLTLDKLEAGKLELDWDCVELTEVLTESIQQVDPVAQSKSIEIRADIEPVQVLCDRRRLLQVFNNLISNAIKYSPKGSEILVSSKLQEDMVRVSVIDHGCGIPEHQQSKLFDKFFQANAADAGEGFGLGLAICNLIVHEHNGAIGVESKVGQGSTFWFTLPRYRE